MPDTVNSNSSIYFSRSRDLETEQESCVFFISLDKVISHEESHLSEKIMLCDVRDHRVASKCLPNEVTGYWVRFLGPKSKFTFEISLWKSLKLKKRSTYDKEKDYLIKVNEVSIEIENEGLKTRKTTRRYKTDTNKQIVTSSFLKKSFKGDFHTPSFCSREMFLQITSSLADCIENGNLVEFSDLYESFCVKAMEKGGIDRDSIELKLLLSIEKSKFHSTQGDYFTAKKLIQQVVNNVPKSPNKTFLLNRAYSYLASIHLIEGNCGTVEDCLNFLQIDKKGTSFEDVGFFFLLHGEAMMLFSKKLDGLQKELRNESLESLSKAEAAFSECLPVSFHKTCKLNLLRAELYICEHYSNCCDSNIETAKQFVREVEKHPNLISLRTKCHLDLVKSECLFYQEEFSEAECLLIQCSAIAESTFPEFKTSCERFKKRRSILCTTNMSSVFENLDLSQSENNTFYDADVSS